MMKNLFKNLMLVAVAAMAFTACTETNEEVNAVAKKTVITGVAVIDTDDTRSGFTGKEGDVYKSAWDGNETIKVFGDNGLVAETTIDADGKFTAEFDQAPSFITVCSPAEAWTGQYSCTIATEQTPRANSVDPAVHVLQSQSTQVVDGSASISVSPQNGCYGKMTINVADAEIEQVKLDLKGLKYNSYEDSLSYTLNATNTQDNIFWFTIEAPMTIQEFTVTAYCAGDKTLTKTVTIPGDRNLKFDWGRVSTFSVSNLTEQEEVYDYTTASVSHSWGATDKLITFTADGKEDMNVNFAGRSFDGNAIAAGTYTYGDGVYSWGITFGDYFGSAAKVSIATMGSAVVSIVDGCYVMEFNNLVDYNGNLVAERITFKGTITGLDMPDPRQVLATPNATATVDGKTITISWEAVDNAEGYYIECTSSNDIEPISTTETTVTITVPSFSYYSFSVRAVVSEDHASYRSSDAAYVEYNDPRPYLPAPANVTATVDGANATISWDPVEGADGYQVYYYLNSQVYVDVEGTSSTSITLELGYDVSNLYVYVFSVANDDNPDYRSSNSWDAWVVVNTEKDPNASDEFTPDYTITSMSFVQLSTSYYTYQWNLSTSNGLSFRIYTPYSQGSTLQEGEYTYYSGNGNTNGDFTFSTRMFSPAPGSGSMVVSKDGDTYTINLTLVVGSATQKYQYIGTL